MISCIITTYKREPEILKRAIDSIKAQTYKDVEIIIVNDAPEEIELAKKIKAFIHEYDSEIKYIEHEKNMGACVARNTGISNSRGEYIAFLDDDDEWLSCKLEKQYNKIKSDNSSLVFSPYYSVDQYGTSKIINYDLDSIPGKNYFEKLLCFNYIGSTSFPLLRKSSVEEVGGFNLGLKSSQDHELWLKIAKKYEISYISEPLVKYYYSDSAITRSIDNRIQGHEYIHKEFESEYRNNSFILHYRYLFLTNTYFGAKNISQGMRYWGKAFILKPLSKDNLFVIKKILKKFFH